MSALGEKALPSDAVSPQLITAVKKVAWPPLTFYLLACALCAYFLTWTYPIRSLNWRIPLVTAGDGLLSSLIAKTLVEHPWYLVNPRMGAPGQLDWFDFPMADSYHIFLLKLVTLGTSSYGLALNAFYLLGFFLITCTALFVFRKLELSYPSSIAGAILYAFAPYHMFRAEDHLFLTCYYMIPLTVWLILQVQAWTPEKQPFLILRPNKIPRLTKPGIAAVVICIVTGCSGLYYAFFGMMFLVAVGLFDVMASKSFARARIALLFACLIAIVLFLNTVPNALHKAQQGSNVGTLLREPYEAELYGLKVLQLILPVEHHRLPLFARIRNMHPPFGFVSESNYSSLGAIPSLGFACLILGLFAGFLKSDWRLSQLGFLNLIAVLVGATGSLAPVFAYFITPNIRSYTRLSIYIEFFALAAFFIVLEKCLSRLTANRLNPAQSSLFLTVVAAIVMTLGFFDQVAPPDVPGLMAGDTYIHDFETYIALVETGMPAGAMVLQLPFMSYPESPQIVDILPYEPLNAYLASYKLRWSYGATRGRYTAAWIDDLSARPPAQILEYAAFAGFQGILIDRYGYRDRGASLEQAFGASIDVQPLENPNKRFAFYDLRPYANRLRTSYSEADWKTAQSYVMDPLAVALRGCSEEEHAQGLPFRWCGREARIEVDNRLTSAQRFTVKGRLFDESPGPAQIEVISPWFHEMHSLLTTQSFPIDKTVEVPPGRSIIRFRSDGVPVFAPTDKRRLFFQLQQLEFRAANAGIEVQPPKGCYDTEHAPNLEFRWCQSQADVPIDNPSAKPIEVVVQFRLVTGSADPAGVQIDGPGFSEKVQTSSAGSVYQHVFVLPSGQTQLHLATTAARIKTPTDPRILVFQLANFQVQETRPAAHLITLP